MISKTYFFRFALLVLTLIWTSATAFADVKIKMRSGSADGGAASSEYTTYIKGKRQRTEAEGQGVSLMQCDLRRTVQLVPAAKTYLVTGFDELNRAGIEVTKTSANTETAVVRGGTVTTIYTTRDTGERKQMFGYTARRVVRTIETEPSPDACRKEKSKIEIDSWVIDAEFALVCDNMNIKPYASRQTGGCQDKQIVKNVGTGKPGFELYSKMTIFDEGGRSKYSTVTEAIELSKATLDAALFEVPADYREAKNANELYAAATSGDSTNGASVRRQNSATNKSSSTLQMPQMPNSGDSSSAPQTVTGSSGNVSNNVGAKKPGVIRLGLAGVKTGATGEGVNAQELSAAVQNTLAEYLKMPNVEIVALEAKLPSAIDSEAKSKECDFVIYATVSHKKGGGGMFGKALGKLSETVAGRAYGSADTVGKASQITIMTAAAATGNVKSKDQITLEIKLVAPGNAASVAAKQFQAKAKSDGDDIITPLVEQAAQMIVDAAAKK